MGEKETFDANDLADLAENSDAIVSFNKEALIRIVRALLGLAFRDRLTQLWNRNFFEIRFQGMLKRAVRTPSYRGCAILIIDLNDFKVINDTEGHRAGDKFLRKTGKALMEAVYNKKADVVARVGGDEFGVLMEDISYFDAQGAVRRLSAVLTSHGVSASIGALYCPPVDNLDGKRIIDRADGLMYAAKHDPNRQGMVVWRMDVYTPTIV